MQEIISAISRSDFVHLVAPQQQPDWRDELGRSIVIRNDLMQASLCGTASHLPHREPHRQLPPRAAVVDLIQPVVGAIDGQTSQH